MFALEDPYQTRNKQGITLENKEIKGFLNGILIPRNFYKVHWYTFAKNWIAVLGKY